MIKIILEIIGIIIGFGLIIVGIVLGGKGMIALFEELIIINENIAWSVLAIIYGLFISILVYRCKSIISDRATMI